MAKANRNEIIGWTVGIVVFLAAAYLIYYAVQPKEDLQVPTTLPSPEESAQ